MNDDDFVPAHMLEKAPDESWRPNTDGTIQPRPPMIHFPEAPVTEVPLEMFYKKPKWWQWRLKRKYKKLLTTNND